MTLTRFDSWILVNFFNQNKKKSLKIVWGMNRLWHSTRTKKKEKIQEESEKKSWDHDFWFFSTKTTAMCKLSAGKTSVCLANSKPSHAGARKMKKKTRAIKWQGNQLWGERRRREKSVCCLRSVIFTTIWYNLMALRVNIHVLDMDPIHTAIKSFTTDTHSASCLVRTFVQETISHLTLSDVLCVFHFQSNWNFMRIVECLWDCVASWINYEMLLGNLYWTSNNQMIFFCNFLNYQQHSTLFCNQKRLQNDEYVCSPAAESEEHRWEFKFEWF